MPFPTPPRRGLRAGLAACMIAGAGLLVPTAAVSDPPAPDDSWPLCQTGFFNSEDVGSTVLGIAGGMQIKVVWQNQSFFTGLPVTLDTDGVSSDHWLWPRESTTEYGPAHFVFGDYRRYPEFRWSLSADTPADAVLLSYKVYAPRCQGSDS